MVETPYGRDEGGGETHFLHYRVSKRPINSVKSLLESEKGHINWLLFVCTVIKQVSIKGDVLQNETTRNETGLEFIHQFIKEGGEAG